MKIFWPTPTRGILKKHLSLQKAAKYIWNPIKAYRRLKELVSNQQATLASAAQFLEYLTFRSPQEITSLLEEVKKHPLFYKQFHAGRSGDLDICVLYAAIRMLQPSVVVETGIASGRSSAFILQALEENKTGCLYSIDQPRYYHGRHPGTYTTSSGHAEFSGFLPQNREPGWLVPNHLRKRWKPVYGSSREVLPRLLDELKSITLFYHDSDHSYENMAFEMNLAWKHLSEGGILLVDDVGWNTAFEDFTRNNGIQYAMLCLSLGGAKKTSDNDAHYIHYP